MAIRKANNMAGKSKLIAEVPDDFDSVLWPRYPINLESEIVIRTSDKDDLDSGLQIVYSLQDDLDSVLQAKIPFDLDSALSVRPHNTMYGITDVVEPPTTTFLLSPIKDAFLRDRIPRLNYGTEEDMFVGTSYGGEHYRAAMQFGPLGVPEHRTIKRATLRLQLLNSNPLQQIGLYEIPVRTEWEETGITWANQPQVDHLLKTFDSGVYPGLVTVDLTELVRQWYKGTATHNGFLLKQLDESIPGFKQYSTRESKLERPVLEVEFFDPTIVSYGRAQLASEIKVIAHRDYDFDSVLEVNPIFWEALLEGDMIVRDPKVPIDDDKESELVVSRPEFDSELKVLLRDDDVHPGELLVRARGEPEDLEAVNGVSRPILNGELYVRFFDDLDGSMYVRGALDCDMDSVIQVSRPNLEAEITIRPYQDFGGSILIRGGLETLLETDIAVSRPQLVGELNIRYYNNLDASLDIAYRTMLESELMVMIKKDISLDSDLSVIYAEMLDSALIVNSPYMAGEIIVRVPGEEFLDAELYVREVTDDDKDSVLYIRAVEQELHEAAIIVRAPGVRDWNSAITVRIRLGSDLASDLIVVHAFTMDSQLAVRQLEENDLDSALYLVGKDKHDLDSLLQARYSRDLDSTVTVRVEGNHDQASSVTVRARGAEDLDSGITISGEVYYYCFIM